MTFFEQSVFFGVSVSLAAYGIGVLLQKKYKFALYNPLLITEQHKKKNQIKRKQTFRAFFLIKSILFFRRFINIHFSQQD